MAGGYTNLDKVKLTPGGYRRVQHTAPSTPPPQMFIPSDSEEDDPPPSYQVCIFYHFYIRVNVKVPF